MKQNYKLKATQAPYTILTCALILLSYISTAQNIVFTIDNAVDADVLGNSNPPLTETIIAGGDTYVLSIFHINELERTDPVASGSSDLVFYLGTSNSNVTPFLLSITKNGEPSTFKLNGIDYDAINPASAGLANQDDDIISPISLYSGSGALNITNPTNAMGITQIKILASNNNDFTNMGFHNIDIDILETLSIGNDVDLDKELSLYPNPSQGIINIANGTSEIESVIISDISGRLIETFLLNEATTYTSLDLRSKLTSGIYLVSVMSKKATVTKKLIIN